MLIWSIVLHILPKLRVHEEECIILSKKNLSGRGSGGRIIRLKGQSNRTTAARNRKEDGLMIASVFTVDAASV